MRVTSVFSGGDDVDCGEGDVREEKGLGDDGGGGAGGDEEGGLRIGFRFGVGEVGREG